MELAANGVEGDRGVGDPEKRGWEKSGREAGFPRWQEVGEKGRNYAIYCATFCNRKHAKRWKPTNTGREPGLKGTGMGRF